LKIPETCRIVGTAHTDLYGTSRCEPAEHIQCAGDGRERNSDAGLEAIATDVLTYLQGIQSAPPPQGENEDMETDGKVLMISWWPTQFSETAVDSHCQSTARFGAMARIRQEHFRVFCVQDES